jgi:hypothetical protein
MQGHFEEEMIGPWANAASARLPRRNAVNEHRPAVLQLRNAEFDKQRICTTIRLCSRAMSP